MQGRFIVILCLILSIAPLKAQQVEVRSGFLQDSVSVGEEITYWLAATYPAGQDLLFPDSTYGFGNWEFLSKDYTTSQLRGQLAYDSAVYSLQSFEIDPVQSLRLPVSVFLEEDSSKIWSSRDSIFFRELAPVVSDTTSLKTNFSYLKVKRAFNMYLWLIIIGAVVLLVFLLLLIFGKKIRRYLKLRKMKKEFLTFSDRFAEKISAIRQQQNLDTIEEAIDLWKRYAEKLESEPFRKLTTTEILEYPFTTELKDALKSIDRAVYARKVEEHIYKSFEVLEDYTSHRYQLKKAEVQNGR
mgnify:CR=1 FL=1